MSYRIVKNEQGQRVARLKIEADIMPETLESIASLANRLKVSIDDYLQSLLLGQILDATRIEKERSV